jgi:hypothetical protein
MKKALLSIAAAALALAPAAGLARPMWIPVSADGSCMANANSITRETLFLHVQVSCKTPAGYSALVISVECGTWHQFISVDGKDLSDRSVQIHPNTMSEAVAYLACDIAQPPAKAKAFLF